MTQGRKNLMFKITGAILLILMLSFTTCDTVSSCWACENKLSGDWQEVCNAMTKNKLESYGYVCTPY